MFGEAGLMAMVAECRRAAIQVPVPMQRPAWMSTGGDRSREWTPGEEAAYTFHYALRWLTRQEVSERVR
eukprot:10417878-Alexandrium_andersonii.AAC.1